MLRTEPAEEAAEGPALAPTRLAKYHPHALESSNSGTWCALT